MDVRDALLKAAIKVFAEAGTRGATTRRIAQEAGVNEVTLFRHFQSKDELIRAALQYFVQQTTHQTLPDEPQDPAAELTAWCRDHHRHLHRVRSLVRKMMGEYEERPEQCQQGMQVSIRLANELTYYLRQLKARGLASGDWDERAAAAMLMGALFTDALGRDTMPERYPYSMRDAVEKYVHLFLNGIGSTSTRASTSSEGAHEELKLRAPSAGRSSR
jgi:AcrR family transcriptional regulator